MSLKVLASILLLCERLGISSGSLKIIEERPQQPRQESLLQGNLLFEDILRVILGDFVPEQRAMGHSRWWEEERVVASRSTICQRHVMHMDL